MLFQLPRECRVFTVLQPAVQWGWHEILLNRISFSLELLVWMKTKDAQRKIPQNKPKQFVPEFMANQVEKSEMNKGVEVHTTDELQSILDRPRV